MESAVFPLVSELQIFVSSWLLFFLLWGQRKGFITGTRFLLLKNLKLVQIHYCSLSVGMVWGTALLLQELRPFVVSQRWCSFPLICSLSWNRAMFIHGPRWSLITSLLISLTCYIAVQGLTFTVSSRFLCDHRIDIWWMSQSSLQEL